MKQKLKITRRYDPKHGMLLYYGYKYVFFNLIKEYVCLSWNFEDCEKKLLEMLQSYAEVTIKEWYK